MNTSNGDVIVWGSDTSFFAIRVDSTLDLQWGKRFVGHGGIQFIKELPDGDLLAGANMATAGGVLMRMNSAGEVLWSKSYMRPRGMMHDAVVESDGSIVVIGVTDSTTANAFMPLPGSFQPELFMMRLNGSGEVQWCRGYDSAPNYWYTPKVSHIERTTDGNYVVLATLGHPGYNFFHRPFLMKTDLNGDTLWTRSVGRTGFDHYAMDLLESSSGGFLLSGWIWGDLPGSNLAMPYIFKTDSLGHFSCWEHTQPIQVLDLFPTDSSFVLNAMAGAEEQAAFMNDTIFPVASYDGCTFSTGIPSDAQQEKQLAIRPNPNTGRFTLEFKDPLLAESWYSVYDAAGKLLFQRPLPPGKGTEEVDLSRYGKGTYVIKCTDRDGVYHERVVVE